MVDRAKQELRAAGKPFLPAALPEPPPMHDQVGPAQMQLDQQSGGVLDVILSVSLFVINGQCRFICGSHYGVTSSLTCMQSLSCSPHGMQLCVRFVQLFLCWNCVSSLASC